MRVCGREYVWACVCVCVVYLCYSSTDRITTSKHCTSPSSPVHMVTCCGALALCNAFGGAAQSFCDIYVQLYPYIGVRVCIGVLDTSVYSLLPLPHASETHMYLSVVCGVLAVISWAKVCMYGCMHVCMCACVCTYGCARHGYTHVGVFMWSWCVSTNLHIRVFSHVCVYSLTTNPYLRFG